jgi:Ca-activated chloride channel homolog
MLFKNPVFLVFVPLAVAALFLAHRIQRQAAFRFSSARIIPQTRQSWKAFLSGRMLFVRAACVTLALLALARPQSPVDDSRVETEGIDICLALDCSTSMLAEDFTLGGKRQSRLEIVKEVVRDFIKGRDRDRIGIVAFAGRPYIVSPLTLDYGWLLQNLERVTTGMIEDGTAIGSGILTSVNRLKDTKAKSKVVVLMTDGRNNAGAIDPVTAAETAKALGIKIYTIGAGSRGPVPYPMKDIFGQTVYQQIEIDIDEDKLKSVAAMTGGQYFRATDTESLRTIYREIDQMEKSPIQDRGYQEYHELFGWFAVPALFLLLTEVFLSETVLRRIP